MLEGSQIRPFSHACTPGTGTSRLKILRCFKLLPDQPAISVFAFLTGILHSSCQWLHSRYRSWEVDEAVPGGCHWSAILWGEKISIWARTWLAHMIWRFLGWWGRAFQSNLPTDVFCILLWCRVWDWSYAHMIGLVFCLMLHECFEKMVCQSQGQM